MKTILFITIATYAFLSYSQPNEDSKVGFMHDHHKMMAAHGCTVSSLSRKQHNKNWTYLKSGSPKLNRMMIDWHDKGQNVFGYIRNI
ncbi:MAG: hypothetical protein JAY60_20610 [Candidatus Thiodiazotropha weberae]|nr:hypothetical protein [Candidatus Thiodiazotropha weberae]MCG7916070.1 hypothetical protein [Candidatus Thiodiazotropha weberae]